MELKDVILVRNGEPVVGTCLIAQGLGRQHKPTIKTIERHKKDFKALGDLKPQKLKSTGGRPVIEFLLNKTQCLLLAGMFRTSKKNISFLSALISNFDKADKTLKKILQALDSFDSDDIDVRYIYAAQDSLGRLKIGISNNPERRIRELNIGNADELKLVYVKDTVVW